MPTSFDLKTGTWKIAWPERVSRHDLVYQSPPTDPIQGLPIGNGEVGLLAWCDGSKLICAVNKSDLWDDAKFGRFCNWRPSQEEFSTAIRHAGRIEIDFQLPVFDLFYLSDFRGRVSLADAGLEVSAAGPFGSVRVRAFVDHASSVLCFEVETRMKESVPVRVRLERFGSRTFSHWYSLVRRDPALGLGGTSAKAAGRGLYLTHKLTSGTFAMALEPAEVKGLKVQTQTDHSHAATMTVGGGPVKRFSFLAAVTSPMGGGAMNAARKALANVRKAGLAGVRKRHAAAWKEFWTRSLMEFGDDYLDSLWHLTIFYAACSQRGKYPGRFINGLWTWNRDVQNWNFYFHWNQQQVYWPLNAAGHHDLVEPYLRYRFNSLPYAKADARTAFKTDGAVISDVCERRGYNSEGEFHNHTPAAQIAMEFWRQYRYTGDRKFLRERALPFLLEAAKFLESRFEKEKDGKYHAKEGTGYEGWIRLHDCVSELVYGRVLLSTALAALEEAGVDEPRAKKWKEILANLAPLPIIPAGKDAIVNGRLNGGLFVGDRALSNRRLAAGYGVKEKRWLSSLFPKKPSTSDVSQIDLFETFHMQQGKPPIPNKPKDNLGGIDGIFPWVEFSAVFPSGLVGLAQKGTDLYKVTANTVKMIAHPGMGWLPLPMTLAWLGLAEEARRALDIWVIFWQFYRNGWGHYGPMAIMKAESSLPERMSHFGIRDATLKSKTQQEKNKFSLPMWPFRHMGMEAMSVLAAGMNEMLLQSHDGTIRVGPAATKKQNARFTLHAQGGFEVSAELREGRPEWIVVLSKLGNTCRLENPWKRAVLYTGGKKVRELTGKTVAFETVAGRLYTLAPDDKVVRNWKTQPEKPARNEAEKVHASKYATLGSPRMY